MSCVVVALVLIDGLMVVAVLFPLFGLVFLMEGEIDVVVKDEIVPAGIGFIIQSFNQLLSLLKTLLKQIFCIHFLN